MTVRVAVHQPNFLPWCGYFAKMMLCDAFVFFDDVQLPQGRSFVSRVKIAKGHDEEQWLTAPVRKGSRLQISDVRFADEPWAEKHLRTLHHTYSKARCFDEVSELITPVFQSPGEELAAFNMQVVEKVARYLGWQGAFYRSSEFPAELTADERIAQLVSAVGGDSYVSGAGGENYQSREVYAAQGVTLDVRAYTPVPYYRSGWPWVPGLSILDALFHRGRDAGEVLLYP